MTRRLHEVVGNEYNFNLLIREMHDDIGVICDSKKWVFVKMGCFGRVWNA